MDRLQELYRLRDRVALEIRLELRRLAGRSVAATKPVKLSRQTHVSADTVRTWARTQGLQVGERGRIKEDVWAAYFRANRHCGHPHHGLEGHVCHGELDHA